MSEFKNRSSQQGFSLVEILIAVTIMVIMGSVVAVNVFPFLFKSQRDRAEIDIGVLKDAVGLFRMSEHRSPRDSEWPDFLANGSDHHKEAYIDEDKIQNGEVLDPWENPYVYRRLSARGFEIISYGADGVPGGEGDDADIRLRKEGR